MMFSETPIVDQLPSASAVSRSTRVTAPVPFGRIEDAYPVIGQVHVAQLSEVRLDGEPERGVERVHRTVSFCCRHDALVAYVGLDRRLCSELARRGPRVDEKRTTIVVVRVSSDRVPGAPIGDDTKRLDPEQVAEPPTQRAGSSPHQELERPVGRLEVITVVLEVLQGVEDSSQSWRVELEAQLGSLQLKGRASRKLAHDDASPVAHDVGRHVLVRVGPADERARVQTGLVRERCGPDIRPSGDRGSD